MPDPTPASPSPQFTAAAPMSPGTYLRKRREAAGLELEELALMLGSDPQVSARTRAEMIAAVERDAAPVTEDLLRALLSAGTAWNEQGRPYRVHAFPFDPVVLIKLMDAFSGVQTAGCTALNPKGEMPRLCTSCGCSDHDPCGWRYHAAGGAETPCHWVGADRCSACVPVSPGMPS